MGRMYNRHKGNNAQNNNAGHGSPIDVGKARRSQAASTFGPGTLVDFGKGSFVVLATDSWDASKCDVIFETRLQKILRKKNFRLPPVRGSDDENNPSAPAIPVSRFPRWYTCGQCGRLGEAGTGKDFEPDPQGNLQCNADDECVNSMRSPVRFIVCCEDGHLDEFPWHHWVHQNAECRNHRLTLRSSGRSAELSELFVHCERCNRKRNLGEAFLKNVMEKYVCNGRTCWTGGDRDQCGKPLRTLLRGGSNLYFPVDTSALSIPPFSSLYFKEYEGKLDLILSGDRDFVVTRTAAKLGVTEDEVVADLEAYLRGHGKLSGEETEDQLREQEYEVLCRTYSDPTGEFSSIYSTCPETLQSWFSGSAQVNRLREVRVRVAFSRIEPRSARIEDVRRLIGERKLISVEGRSESDWLPAVEIRGEGIFLQFRTACIKDWIDKNPGLENRGRELLRCAMDSVFPVICGDDWKSVLKNTMIHSFAHALIRQISLDCGYSTASLRERLYLSGNCAGVLIYTGSPDSEGSLGGLVRLGRPEKIADLVSAAVNSSRWCGSDPVCGETEPGTMGDRVSGAACHSCLLLPETSCERFNKLLDRTLLAGHPEGRWKGYFE